MERWVACLDVGIEIEIWMSLGPPEGGQASNKKLEWMEELKDAVVVVPEPMEAAWTLEEVVSQ